MRAEELDFHLPPELIAQSPAPDRAASRLLHYRRDDRSVTHRVFHNLPSLLRSDDLLVFNDAKVIPARFTLRKPTGAQIEGLFLGQTHSQVWDVMLKNLGPVKDGVKLSFVAAADITASVVGRLEGGGYQLRVDSDEPAVQLLERLGRMPLPPYIRRHKAHDERDGADRERYQTVYAKESGSVAAPTAGLHFTPQILQELDSRQVERASLTLHVGLGTFKPIATVDLRNHAMHSESYTIPQATAERLNRAKSQRRRIVAVGTTSTRVLESQPADRPFEPCSSRTSIFIYPPYEWKHVGALITNFHLPRSTLIALVAAMVGLGEQRRIYDIAIRERYRFFSYGDAMLIE